MGTIVNDSFSFYWAAKLTGFSFITSFDDNFTLTEKLEE